MSFDIQEHELRWSREHTTWLQRYYIAHDLGNLDVTVGAGNNPDCADTALARNNLKKFVSALNAAV